jgi:excisionase family DNA binding protein
MTTGLEQEHYTAPALLTNEQAAAYLGLQPDTLCVWRSLKINNIPYIKIGRNVRYRPADLEAYLLSKTVK